VIATVREEARARVLAASGVEAWVVAALETEGVRELVPEGAEVLVAFPPDGATDARIAPALAHARAVAYLSTTGVYGPARGCVDENTPVDRATPRAALRLAAEDAYRAVGAVVLRAAGIYGPGRGLHVRIARGDFRVPGDGGNVVSRIHVEDLAELALAALARGRRGAVYTVADDAPVPQIEAIAWLCARLGVPRPPSVPVEEAAEALRHDRRVSNARAKRELQVRLRYPSYREGFAACLEADAARG
jgi:nucleoside-diphosphate-sugar epimerase